MYCLIVLAFLLQYLANAKDLISRLSKKVMLFINSVCYSSSAVV
jgi:hypothetical protein